MATNERVQRLGLAAVVLATIGMFFGTAQGGGADEPVHQATAWYVWEHGMPPRHDSLVDLRLPGSAVVGPCYWQPPASAACLPDRSDVGVVEHINVFNKPPVYYWAVGAGQRLVNAVDDHYVDLGGRVASLLLNLVTLAVLIRRLRRLTPQWGTFLLLCLTPMACFYWAVVNPSGWEVAMALLFAVVFATAWWSPATERPPPRRDLVTLAVVSTLFALTRPNAFVWLLCIMGVVALARPPIGPEPTRRARRRPLLLSAGAGVFVALAWNVAYPSKLARLNPDYVEHPGVKDYARWFYRSMEVLPRHTEELFGGLGWLDTHMPSPLFALTIVAWIAVFGHVYGARPALRRPILAATFCITVLPSIIETAGFDSWPYWWSGRYTLPLAAALVLVLLLRFGAEFPGALRLLSLIAVVDLTVMVWVNFMRYAKGPNSYLPNAHLAAGAPRIVGVAVVVAGLLAILVLMVRDAQSHGIGRPNK